MNITWMLLLAILLSAPTSWALDWVASAKVIIVKSIDIASVTELDFGNISRLNGTCTMASSGGLSGSDGQDCTGTSSPGVFQLNGANNQSVILKVTAGASVNGVSFSPKIDGDASLALTDGTASVQIIGDLILTDATLGEKNIAYTLTANYQ